MLYKSDYGDVVLSLHCELLAECKSACVIMSCSPPELMLLCLQGIREFWAGEAADTGMGRKLQHALQFAEDVNYNNVLEELSTMCTP